MKNPLTPAAVSRRDLFRGAGAVTIGGLSTAALAACDPATPTVTPTATSSVVAAPTARTSLTLLGTAGGPVVYGDRTGISSAVKIEDSVYLVDIGHGALGRYVSAPLAPPDLPPNQQLTGLTALFLTHMHSDHLAELASLWMTGMWNGLRDPQKPVHVYGPGDRGGLPPLANPDRNPEVISPGAPTIGTVAMLNALDEAFAADLNERVRGSGGTPPSQVFIGHDIALPTGVPAPVDERTMPRISPFQIYEDDLVKVTATLVNHYPVFPAFAFRFDSDDGSITFSGDTARSDNLIELAQGTDILVHEILDEDALDRVFPEPRDENTQARVDHIIESHTPIRDVGDVAAQSGAKHLVLHHMYPINTPVERWMTLRDFYDGEITVGADLQAFGIG